MPDEEHDGAGAESLHLLTIFMEIDRRVAADEEARARVSSVLPAFAGPGLFTGIDEVLEVLEITPPSLDDALAWMAAAENAPGSRSAARRMMAFAGLLRADAGFGVGNEPVGNALRPFMQRDDPDELLARLLADSPLVPNVYDWWREVILGAVGSELLDPVFGLQAGAPPSNCTVSDREPQTGARTLTTSFVVDLSLAEVLDYLHPENWQDCTDVWCVMREEADTLPPPPHWFREEIALDCGGPRLVTYLDFVFKTFLGLAKSSYNLSTRQGSGASRALDIDEGEIIATGSGGQTLVTTWKRLHFVGPYSSLNDFIVVLACLLGYGTVAEDMVFSCAARQRRLKAKWEERVTHSEGGKMLGPDQPDTIADCYAAMFRVFSSCVEECVDAYRDAAGRAERGEYKADDLTQDMARSWRRAERHMFAVYRAGLDPRRHGAP